MHDFFVKSHSAVLDPVISRVFFLSYFRFVGDDDSDNEITDHKTRKITSSDDLGDYVSEQMTWTPSRADLCNFDATVSSFLLLENLTYTSLRAWGCF
jgi:hypothetical protein